MAEYCTVLWMMHWIPPPSLHPGRIFCGFNCRNIVDVFETKSCSLVTNEFPRNRSSQTLILKSTKIALPLSDFDEIGQG
jgi:hypothetical protein